ncbi:MAG TPA: Gmad2 immunoglobulin-like domain-containing protein [Candidatus Paceibacterota bacterium]|nr:Gmad2 immunoglobulin-like domain-containing protein [Candidatus Paceibacterota bacterium]
MNALTALKILAVVFAVIIVVLLAVLIFYPGPAKAPTVPAGVISSDGHMAVTSLKPDGLVASPLTVTGAVTGGGWFYEATFPVKVLDSDGTELGVAAAQAQADWTSTGTVPFTAIVQFSAPQGATGTVVLSKDNPSGDPANDESLSIPVRFK